MLRIREHLTPTNALATLCLAAVLMSTSWAAPVRKMVTGKEIRNSSITGIDIRDGSLTAKDFSRGALSGARGQAGAPGANGSPGATGSPGANGQPGANGTAGANGQPGANGTAGANGNDGAAGATGAPGAESPGAGARELYAFVSYETGRSAFVTLIGVFGASQRPALGPDALGFDDATTYSFHADRDNDGTLDIRYDVKFTTTVAPNRILRAEGHVTTPADPDVTVR